MSVNELSIQVYHEIIEEGLVGRLQGLVLDAIVRSTDHPTVNEIGEMVGVRQRTTFAPRVLELEKLGVVEKAGKRKCQITGRIGHTYRFTGRRPTRRMTSLMTCPFCHGTGKLEKVA